VTLSELAFDSTRVQLGRLTDRYPRRAVRRDADMSVSDRERAGAFWDFSVAVTEVQGESPALQGGDESDRRRHNPPTIAQPDIPTDIY